MLAIGGLGAIQAASAGVANAAFLPATVAAPAAASALTLGESLLFLGALTSGIAGFTSSQRQADLARENAKSEQARIAWQAEQERKELRRKRGSLIARAGASGAGIGGSVFDLDADMAAQSRQNQLILAYNSSAADRRGKLESDAYKEQGAFSLLGGATTAGAIAAPTLLT